MKIVPALLAALACISAASAQNSSEPQQKPLRHGTIAHAVDWAKQKSGGKMRQLMATPAATQVILDAKGRTAKVLEPDSFGKLTIETDFTYDAKGHVVSIVQRGKEGDTPRTRTFTFDENSHVVSAASPEAGSVTYTYDPAGNIASKTDARGITISYAWDANKRLLSKSYSDGTPSANFVYLTPNSTHRNYLDAPAGRQFEHSYHYDARGGIDSIVQRFPSPDGFHAYGISLSYDRVGRLVAIRYPDGRVVTQTWTTKGHLASVADAATTYLAETSYSTSGFLDAALLGNGVAVSRTYTTEDRLNSFTAAIGDKTLLNKVYSYDSQGSLSKVTDQLHPNESVSYAYDALHRVTRFLTSNGTVEQHFSYDAFGNRGLPDDTSVRAQFNEKNRFDASNGLTYDEAGEMTFDGSHRYSYNAEGLIADVDDGAIRYRYDAEGKRAQKIVDGAVDDYIWLEGQLLAEHRTDGTWVDYVYANGTQIASVTVPAPDKDGKAKPPSTAYFLTDTLGITRMALSQKAKVIADSLFAPFGEQTRERADESREKFSAASISFTGEFHDTETGLDNYQYRSYNPKLGRWMTPDPSSLKFSTLSNPQSFNLYAYVMNDPLKYLDGHGLELEECTESGGEDDGCGWDGGSTGGGGGGSGGGGGGATDPCATDPFCVTVTTDPPVDPCPPDTCTTVTVNPDPPIDPEPPVDTCPADTCVEVSVPPLQPVDINGLIQQAKQLLSANCKSKLSNVVPGYSTNSFFTQLANTPFQQYPNVNSNLPSDRTIGADADTQLALPGRPIRLFPNFYTDDPTYQAFVLIHEGIHRFTGWTDAQVFANLASSGLQAPGNGYGTGNITTWLEGGCKP